MKGKGNMKNLKILFTACFIMSFTGLVFLSIELMKKNLLLHEIYKELMKMKTFGDKNKNDSISLIMDHEYNSVLNDYQEHLKKFS